MAIRYISLKKISILMVAVLSLVYSHAFGMEQQRSAQPAPSPAPVEQGEQKQALPETKIHKRKGDGGKDQEKQQEESIDKKSEGRSKRVKMQPAEQPEKMVDKEEKAEAKEAVDSSNIFLRSMTMIEKISNGGHLLSIEELFKKRSISEFEKECKQALYPEVKAWFDEIEKLGTSAPVEKNQQKHVAMAESLAAYLARQLPSAQPLFNRDMIKEADDLIQSTKNRFNQIRDLLSRDGLGVIPTAVSSNKNVYAQELTAYVQAKLLEPAESVFVKGDSFMINEVLLKNTPQLFQFLQSAAQRLKIAVPKIFVTVNKSVMDSAAHAGQDKEEARIVIGLEGIDVFSASALEAILAHEMGHIALERQHELFCNYGEKYQFREKPLIADVLCAYVFHLPASIADRYLLPALHNQVFHDIVVKAIKDLVITLTDTFIGRHREYQADAIACMLVGQQAVQGALSEFYRYQELDGFREICCIEIRAVQMMLESNYSPNALRPEVGFRRQGPWMKYMEFILCHPRMPNILEQFIDHPTLLDRIEHARSFH